MQGAYHGGQEPFFTYVADVRPLHIVRSFDNDEG